MRLKRATLKPAISHKLGLYSRVFCISITHFKNKILLMARSVIQSVIFVVSQQCRKFTWQRIPKAKPDISSEKNITFCNINEWLDLLKKLFTTQNLVLKQQALSEIKLQFASGDVFRRSLYSSRGLSMSQLSHHHLPFGQKFAFSSSHYTSGSHFQFVFYRFAISQFANYQTRTLTVAWGACWRSYAWPHQRWAF